MVKLNESYALADFQQNASRHLRRLTKTGQPAVLTVKGKPAMVVQAARAYQRMLDAIEKAETIAGIKLGLDSMAKDKGETASTVFPQLRRKLRIVRKE